MRPEPLPLLRLHEPHKVGKPYRCCHICKISRIQYPIKFKWFAKCDHIICKNCFREKLVRGSWEKASMRPIIEIPCPVCEEDCLCRRCIQTHMKIAYMKEKSRKRIERKMMDVAEMFLDVAKNIIK